VKNVHSRFSDKLVDLSALKSENKSFDYACVSVSREEGESLSSLIAEKAYRETIEIGCAFRRFIFVMPWQSLITFPIP